MKAKRKVTDKNWEFDGTTARAPAKPRPGYCPHPDDLERHGGRKVIIAPDGSDASVAAAGRFGRVPARRPV